MQLLFEIDNEGWIKANSNKVIKNLKMNSEYDSNANVTRMRIKLTALINGVEHPMDIAVYELKVGMEIKIDGTELLNKIPFTVRINSSIFSNNYVLEGIINKRKIKISADNIPKLLMKLPQLLYSKKMLNSK